MRRVMLFVLTVVSTLSMNQAAVSAECEKLKNGAKRCTGTLSVCYYVDNRLIGCLPILAGGDDDKGE